MKILRKILIVIVAIVAIVLIIAIFVKKDYLVERQITINKPKQEVFDYIKYLKNQDNFSKWATMDPEMIKTYRGTDGQPGFVSHWESKNENVGVGEQEIIKITEGERVDFELRFFEPFEATDKAFMITEALSENETKVVWGFDGHMAYPMNLMLLFMDFEEMLAGDLEEGLANLRTELEKQ